MLQLLIMGIMSKRIGIKLYDRKYSRGKRELKIIRNYKCKWMNQKGIDKRKVFYCDYFVYISN